MNLTWHLAKKDLRRLALPVALWIVFIVGTAVWLRSVALPEEVLKAGAMQRWIGTVNTMASLIAAGQMIASVLLTGFLVLEDVVGGTTSHWQTRPIAGARLLAAKLIVAALLLVLAPVVALMPVWLASGFSAAECVSAATEFAGWQLVATVIAMGIASLVENLGQFAFATAVLAMLYGLGPLLGDWLRIDHSKGVMLTARGMIFALPLVVMPAVLWQNYLTRLPRRGWLVIATGLAAVVAVSVAWPGDFNPLFQTVPSRTTSEVTVEKIEMPGNRERPAKPLFQTVPLRATSEVPAQYFDIPGKHERPASMILSIGGAKDNNELLAPSDGSGALAWVDGRQAKFGVERGGSWGAEAARRLAGLERSDGTTHWDMGFWLKQRADAPLSARGSVTVTGTVDLVRVRGRVVCELPLREGASAQAGSSFTRIAALGRMPIFDGTAVVVEERERWRKIGDSLNVLSARRDRDVMRTDCYLLVNRRLGIVQCLPIHDVGAAGLSSVAVNVLRLEYEPPTRDVAGRREEIAGWQDGAVLVKVRFERTGKFVQDFAATAVRLETGSVEP